MLLPSVFETTLNVLLLMCGVWCVVYFCFDSFFINTEKVAIFCYCVLLRLVVALVVVRDEHVLSSPSIMILLCHDWISMKGTYDTCLTILWRTVSISTTSLCYLYWDSKKEPHFKLRKDLWWIWMLSLFVVLCTCFIVLWSTR